MKWSHLGQNSNSYFLVFMHKYNYRACCVRKNGITYSGGDLPCRATVCYADARQQLAYVHVYLAKLTLYRRRRRKKGESLLPDSITQLLPTLMKILL